MKQVHYTQLGGTLFIPASHKDLESIIKGSKYPNLKSLVIDFEDGLEVSHFALANTNLDILLQNSIVNDIAIFIRAKNVIHLEDLLQKQNIDKVTGFLLAKFSLDNARKYFALLKRSNFFIMPSIEGQELFNPQKLHQLKEVILRNKQNIVLVRFGLEDMLRQLSMRRKCDESLFDFSITSSVIGNFIATFKSVGFAVSGGVYPCFKDKEGFIKDVKRDMKEGLFCKTIIHPNQIEIINELYKVDKKEYEEALAIVNANKKLFALEEKMIETLTMSTYSEELLSRAAIYGIRE